MAKNGLIMMGMRTRGCLVTETFSTLAQGRDTSGGNSDVIEEQGGGQRICSTFSWVIMKIKDYDGCRVSIILAHSGCSINNVPTCHDFPRSILE